MEKHLAGIVAAFVTAIATMIVLLILLPVSRGNSEVLVAALLLSLSIGTFFVLPAVVDLSGAHLATDAGKIGGIGIATAATFALLVLAGFAMGFALAGMSNFVWACLVVWLGTIVVSFLGLRSSVEKIADISASRFNRSDRSEWLDRLAEASLVTAAAQSQNAIHNVAEVVRYSPTDIPGEGPLAINQEISNEIATLLSACREREPNSEIIYQSCNHLTSLLSQRHSLLLQARTRD